MRGRGHDDDLREFDAEAVHNSFELPTLEDGYWQSIEHEMAGRETSAAPTRNTDFEDLVREEGGEAVRAAIHAADHPWEGKPLQLPVEMFGEITPQLTSRQLVKGLLMAGTSIVIFGAPGCGKSFLAADLALHIAAGREWFGRRTAAGGVLYLAAEGQAGFRARVDAWRRTHGGDDVAFALVPAAIDLLDPRADLSKVRQVLSHVAELWGGIALLVVDTLAATFGGDDENGSDMAAYVANIASLCEPYGCARIIVTHAPLIGDAKRPRGHGSLWGAADTVLDITGDRDTPARRLHVLKQKDADPGPDILFTLKQVEIGTDEDGDRVTSCVNRAERDPRR